MVSLFKEEYMHALHYSIQILAPDIDAIYDLFFFVLERNSVRFGHIFRVPSQEGHQ